MTARRAPDVRVYAGLLGVILCLLALACGAPNEATVESSRRDAKRGGAVLGDAKVANEPGGDSVADAPPSVLEGATEGDEHPKEVGKAIGLGGSGELSATRKQGERFDVAAFVRSLPREAIVFNVPGTVPLGETVRVRLRLEPGTSAEALAADFERGRDGREVGELATRSAPVGDQMSAVLASSGLGITPLSESRKLVSADEPTEWLWDVEARQGGTHTLRLTLSVIPPERVSGREILSLEEEMIVEVTALKRAMILLSDNWEWMWTFIAAPIGGYLWARRRRRQAGDAPAGAGTTSAVKPGDASPPGA